MTIKDLMTGESTITQMDILARADRIGLPAGRYYGGQLTDEQIQTITEGLKLKKTEASDTGRGSNPSRT